MNYYCGTDIIEVNRVKDAILSTPSFKEKIFTPLEIEYAEKKKDITKYLHYAGRFAAKEAVYKAISKLYPHVFLGEIEILNDLDNLNRPYVIIHNDDFKNLNIDISIDISISHIQDYATATAVVYVK